MRRDAGAGRGPAAAAPLVVEGARVVLPDRVASVSVRVEGGRIAGLDAAADGAERIDARGRVLAPALVDVHGDAFERQLMPRPGVAVPLDAALLETDRQLAGSGIATAYHALSVSWEPGLRSAARAGEIVDALARLASRLLVENRVQLRWESFCFEGLELLERAMAGPLAPSLAFNDHTSMMMLDPALPMQERPFDLEPDYPTADTASPAFRHAIERRAARSEVTPDAYAALAAERWSRRPEVPATLERAAALARGRGVPMLSHDDSQPHARAHFRALGARVAEFPMNRATAEAARAAGDWIAFGAPNALRGGSHLGSPSAAEMIDAGLCDILASDYYHPAMLGAVARLHAEGRALPALWRLVSANPARAMGLSDRGEIAPGRRADLVLLDWPEGEAPAPRLVLVAGRRAWEAEPAGAEP